MIDVEALKRFLLLLGLLATSIGWWRAEVHNAQLAESAVGFRDLAQNVCGYLAHAARRHRIEAARAYPMRCAWAALGPWRRT